MKASKELTKEHLVVLGWKDEHWNVLDKVTVKSLQNDLVSFEILENYERYLYYNNTMGEYINIVILNTLHREVLRFWFAFVLMESSSFL